MFCVTSSIHNIDCDVVHVRAKELYFKDILKNRGVPPYGDTLLASTIVTRGSLNGDAMSVSCKCKPYHDKVYAPLSWSPRDK